VTRYLWLIVRLVVVFGSALGMRSAEPSSAEFSAPFFIVFFFPVMGALATRYGVLAFYRGRSPRAPSWLANPFDLDNLFEFVHLCSIAAIIIAVTRSGGRGSIVNFDVAAIAYGLGCLFGIYWAVFASRSAGSQRAQLRDEAVRGR
jgi:membrane associated rhomboid family serine protease